MSPIITAHDVHFSYGKFKALNGINLSINPGEVVAILGPNGAGKTTFVETLIGMMAPDQGTVQVLGTDPAHFSSKQRSQVGLVQQHWKDHEKWRVIEHLEWICAAHQSNGCITTDPIELLRIHGLEHKEKAKMSSLSGGQRRRIDFIAAMISQPSLLILDEPTTGLDPQAKVTIHDTIMSAVDRGTTAVVTTHDLAEAEKIASRIVIIKDGSVIKDGTAPQLRQQLVKPAQITWHEDGELVVHATENVEQFIKTLDLDRISNLTITRPTLEDAYLSLVEESESAPMASERTVS